MSEGPSAFGGSGFFGNLLGDLLKVLQSAGPVHWELAAQMANGVATGGQPEANVDPTERIRLEELVRVADLHVADATGLSTSSGGKLTVVPVGRGEWSRLTLENWRPRLDSLAHSLSSGGPPSVPPDLADVSPPGPDLAKLVQAIGPTLLGMQFGATIGHLAERAMGQYELPIPRPVSDTVVVVPANITAFATDWSLPPDDVRLWLCLSEVTHHAILGRAHVRARLEELLAAYVSGFRLDPANLEDRLAGIDPTDPTSFETALGDPTALLGEIRTPDQLRVVAQLNSLTAVLEGHVDQVMDTVGKRLLGSYGALSEAFRRRRVERGQGERFAERLFGLDLGQDQFDRGNAFIRGVLERNGDDGLNPLWAAPESLPTPAEVDAPGLWLARIGLSD